MIAFFDAPGQRDEPALSEPVEIVFLAEPRLHRPVDNFGGGVTVVGLQRLIATYAKRVIHELEHVTEDTEAIRNLLDDFLRMSDFSCRLDGREAYLPVEVMVAAGRDRMHRRSGLEVVSFQSARKRQDDIVELRRLVYFHCKAGDEFERSTEPLHFVDVAIRTHQPVGRRMQCHFELV